MNNYKNHKILEFDAACKKFNIILIYMPLHLFYLLQSLNVSFFSPLKKMYTKELKNIF